MGSDRRVQYGSALCVVVTRTTFHELALQQTQQILVQNTKQWYIASAD